MVEQWLADKDYFLTDLVITPDSRIVVEIDHEDGVWIDDCVALSRHIESGLDRETEDFELEVGSAGIGQPFKVLRQWEINAGERIEVVLLDGRKLQGVLGDVTPEGFALTITERVKIEGKKRPQLQERQVELRFSEVKSGKYLIDFK